jgi:iron complex outermembrane recepter protein
MSRMLLRGFCCLVVCAGLLWGNGLQAEDAPGLDALLEMSLADLLDVPVVTASKRDVDLMEAPSAISIVTREEILRSPSATIPDLLQYVVGMDGYTKTHTDQDVAARGIAYDETPKMLVLVDGQAINIVLYGGVQWPTLPVTKRDIERIEIVRGPSSALYGADAQVGVVNIITQKASDRQNSASVILGDRGTRIYEARLAGQPSEELSIAVTGSYTQTERKGDVETSLARQAAPNFDIKDWAEIYLLSYRLDYEKEGTSFLSEGGFTTDDEGYNASAGDASIDASEKRTFYMNNQARFQFGEDELGIRIGLRNLWQRNERFGNSGYEFKYEVPKGRGIDVDVQYSVRPINQHSIIVGGNISRFSASRDIANTPPYVYDNSDDLWSVYVQDQIALAQRRVFLTVSGRYDKWDAFDGEFTPRATANVGFNEKKMNFRVSVSTSFRRPSFDERFYFVRFPIGWLKGSEITATDETGVVRTGIVPNLEKLTAYEAGLRFRPNDRVYLDLEVFQNRFKGNLGLTVLHAGQDELNLGIANTGDRVVMNGLEIETKAELAPGVRGFLNYTYQKGTIESPPAGEIDWLASPKTKVSGGVSFTRGVTADIRFRYVSDLTYNEVQAVPVDDYWTVDVGVSREFAKGMRVKVSVNNVFDDARYEYPIYTQITRKGLVDLQYSF